MDSTYMYIHNQTNEYVYQKAHRIVCKYLMLLAIYHSMHCYSTKWRHTETIVYMYVHWLEWVNCWHITCIWNCLLSLNTEWCDTDAGIFGLFRRPNMFISKMHCLSSSGILNEACRNPKRRNHVFGIQNMLSTNNISKQ